MDVARETYKEGLNDAFELCDRLKSAHGLDDMALLFNSSGGTGGGQFVFTIPRAEWDEKEQDQDAEWRRAGWLSVVSTVTVKMFFSVQESTLMWISPISQNKKGKNRVTFSSMELKQRNNRINESVQEIFMLR